jgi:hypothetical protein
MKLIDGAIKNQIQNAIKAYDSLPDWMKEKNENTNQTNKSLNKKN